MGFIMRPIASYCRHPRRVITDPFRHGDRSIVTRPISRIRTQKGSSRGQLADWGPGQRGVRVEDMVTGHSTPTHAVDRPGLRRLLDDALSRPIILMVAPAGAGKSVSLAQWSASRDDLVFLWLSLDAADNDPVYFSRRLLAGVAEIDPEAAQLGELVAMHGGGLGTPLLEALGSRFLELPETVIVLDDLHQLSNPVLVADLGRLAALLPSQVHLLLATRVDPPIAWSHLRLRRHVTEIRQADLAFDDHESAQLLERIAGRPLGPDQVTALVQRTEGWATGLQLAAMMLRLHEDSDAFVAQFSGNDRLIADFLSEEVLGAQSPERRQFLLRVSVLDEICADLAGALTGDTAAQLVLEELERESMFLVPLDSRREWYRFHHLFRDLLRFRLRAEAPGLEPSLLAEAASWHLARGDVGSAVDYLIRARCWDEALDLVMGRGSETFEQGQMATVIRWITAVPETARQNRRDIRLLLAFLKGAEGQSASSEDLLVGVLADPEATPGERACAQTLLATLAQFRSNPEVTVAMAMAALELLDGLDGQPVPVVMNLGDPRALETLALGSCGRGHFLAGHLDEAREWLQRALESAGASYSVWKIGLLGSMALVEAWAGRLERARSLADEALGVARDVGILGHPVTADAFLAASLTSLETGQPRRAALSLREGCLRAEANRRLPLAWVGRLLTAEMEAAEGRPELALDTMATTRTEFSAPPPPLVEGGLLALRCRLLRQSGAVDEAARLLGAQPSTATLLGESVAAALTLGHADLARKLLDAGAVANPEPRAAVERLAVSAWLESVEGTADQARTPLVEALDIAERHNLVEAFIRAGPTVVGLVAEFGETQPAFREAVLQRAREAIAASPGGTLTDPLTDRELEILSFLPSRLTNTELAEQCYVSVNTIKTHMAHIYRKLDAANRNEAIARARRLGLL